MRSWTAWLLASSFCGFGAAVADPPQDAGDPRVPYTVTWDGRSPVYSAENFNYYRSLLQRVNVPSGAVVYAVYLPASTALGAFGSVYFQLGPQPQTYSVCEPRFYSNRSGIDVMLAGREVPLTMGQADNAACSWFAYASFDARTAGVQLQIALQPNAGIQFFGGNGGHSWYSAVERCRVHRNVQKCAPTSTSRPRRALPTAARAAAPSTSSAALTAGHSQQYRFPLHRGHPHRRPRIRVLPVQVTTAEGCPWTARQNRRPRNGDATRRRGSHRPRGAGE